MYVHWKSLISCGLTFWTSLYFADFLGESSWKRYSEHVDDLLKTQFNSIVSMQSRRCALEGSHIKTNWWLLLWTICVFLCSLIFWSVVRALYWVRYCFCAWYNSRGLFGTTIALNNKAQHATDPNKIQEHEENQIEEIEGSPQIDSKPDPQPNCQIIFENKLFSPDPSHKWQSEEISSMQEKLQHFKKENWNLSQQLLQAQEENAASSKKLEEYKIESSVINAKLAKTNTSLEENIKHKNFTNTSKEVMSRKLQNLESAVKDVTTERDCLKNKLLNMEDRYRKLEQSRFYDDQLSKNNSVQIPEKDNCCSIQVTEVIDSEATDTDIDMRNFETKLFELQRNIDNFNVTNTNLHSAGNSKISFDLEESTPLQSDTDTSRITESDVLNTRSHNPKSLYKDVVSSSDDYKSSEPKSKDKFSRSSVYSTPEIRSSSSEDANPPSKIISSTLQFKNFLRNLNTSSNSSFTNYNKKTM